MKRIIQLFIYITFLGILQINAQCECQLDQQAQENLKQVKKYVRKGKYPEAISLLRPLYKNNSECWEIVCLYGDLNYGLEPIIKRNGKRVTTKKLTISKRYYKDAKIAYSKAIELLEECKQFEKKSDWKEYDTRIDIYLQFIDSCNIEIAKRTKKESVLDRSMESMEEKLPINIEENNKIEELKNKDTQRVFDEVNKESYLSQNIKETQNDPEYTYQENYSNGQNRIPQNDTKSSDNSTILDLNITKNNTIPSSLHNTNNGEKLPYLMPISEVFSSKDESLQLEQIQNKIRQLLDNHSAPQKGLTLTDIGKINSQWLEAKSTMNYDWFSKLIRQQSDYLLLNQSIDNITQLIEYNKSQLKVLSNIQGSLENKRKQLLQKKDFYYEQKNNKIEFQRNQKLYQIPKSIVLVGRINDSTGVFPFTNKVISSLVDNMREYATQIINGEDYSFGLQSLNNHTLKKASIKSTGGKTAVPDRYYKDLKLAYRDKNNGYQTWSYQILRIEVLPNTDSIQSQALDNLVKEMSDTLDYFRVEIFRVKLAGDKIILNNGEMDYTISDLSFSQQEEEYIRFQLGFSDRMNAKYNQKINEANSDYLNKLNELESYIKKNEAVTIELEKEIAENNWKIDSIQLEIENLNYELEEFKKQFSFASREYENTWGSKIGYVNKLLIRKHDHVKEWNSIRQFLDDEIEECYDVIKTLREGETKATIFKLVLDGNEMQKTEETNIFYKPEYSHFQILSINEFTEDDISDLYYSINIAFTVNWKIMEDLFINTEFSRVEDKKTNSFWRGYVIEEPTSFDEFSRDAAYIGLLNKDQIRLPELNELQNFITNIIALRNRTNRDPIKDLQWQKLIDYPICIKPEERFSRTIQALKIIDKDSLDYEIVEIKRGNSCSILLIELNE